MRVQRYKLVGIVGCIVTYILCMMVMPDHWFPVSMFFAVVFGAGYLAQKYVAGIGSGSDPERYEGFQDAPDLEAGE